MKRAGWITGFKPVFVHATVNSDVYVVGASIKNLHQLEAAADHGRKLCSPVLPSSEKNNGKHLDNIRKQDV